MCSSLAPLATMSMHGSAVSFGTIWRESYYAAGALFGEGPMRREAGRRYSGFRRRFALLSAGLFGLGLSRLQLDGSEPDNEGPIWQPRLSTATWLRCGCSVRLPLSFLLTTQQAGGSQLALSPQ